MEVQIFNEGACIRVQNSVGTLLIVKDQIRTIEVVHTYFVRVDIGEGPLSNIFLDYRNVTNYNLASANDLRDLLNEMLSSTGAAWRIQGKELYWLSPSGQEEEANNYKLIVGYSASQGNYAGQFKGNLFIGGSITCTDKLIAPEIKASDPTWQLLGSDNQPIITTNEAANSILFYLATYMNGPVNPGSAAIVSRFHSDSPGISATTNGLGIAGYNMDAFYPAIGTLNGWGIGTSSWMPTGYPINGQALYTGNLVFDNQPKSYNPRAVIYHDAEGQNPFAIMKENWVYNSKLRIGSSATFLPSAILEVNGPSALTGDVNISGNLTTNGGLQANGSIHSIGGQTNTNALFLTSLSGIGGSITWSNTTAFLNGTEALYFRINGYNKGYFDGNGDFVVLNNATIGSNLVAAGTYHVLGGNSNNCTLVWGSLVGSGNLVQWTDQDVYYSAYATHQFRIQNSGNYLQVDTTGIKVNGSVLSTGDAEITNNSKGIVLKSPNGSRYRTTVDDAGALVTTLINN